MDDDLRFAPDGSIAAIDGTEQLQLAITEWLRRRTMKIEPAVKVAVHSILEALGDVIGAREHTLDVLETFAKRCQVPVQLAIEAERERCAKLVEHEGAAFVAARPEIPGTAAIYRADCDRIAAAIRRRP